MAQEFQPTPMPDEIVHALNIAHWMGRMFANQSMGGAPVPEEVTALAQIAIKDPVFCAELFTTFGNQQLSILQQETK